MRDGRGASQVALYTSANLSARGGASVSDWFADLSLNYTDFALAFVLVVGGREIIRRLAGARRAYRIVFGTLYAIAIASIIAGWVVKVLYGELRLGGLLLTIAVAAVLATALDLLAQQHRSVAEDNDAGHAD